MGPQLTALSRLTTGSTVGIGGRRVLVSREWSGKTLSERRADRATVVREALLSAGMIGNREFGDCRNVWSVAARCVAMVFCPGDQDGRVTSAPVAIRGLP
jgi:hypothetical protein